MSSWLIIVLFAIIDTCECIEHGDGYPNIEHISVKLNALELELKSLQLEFTALGLRYQQLDTNFRNIGSDFEEIPSTLNAGDWTEWSDCDMSCGGGNQKRYKFCTESQMSVEGGGCSGTSVQSRKCNTQLCPVSGAVYTRWGRTTCPPNGTEMVYTGFTAGGHFTHKGAGTQYLCLPVDQDSDQSTLISIRGWRNYLYGTEYELVEAESILLFGDSLHNQDAPCSVCHSIRHAIVLMIPGRSSCYDGWNQEYHGYLMSGYYDHANSKEYVCVDVAAEKLAGGASGSNGALFYPVTTRCGSLPCPPYVDERAVPCSVCTK